MASWDKQLGSRPGITTTFTSATAVIKAAAETYQLRVINTSLSTAAAWLSIGDSSSATVPATGVGVPIAVNQVGEYFTITPGQWYGGANAAAAGGLSVTEMS